MEKEIIDSKTIIGHVHLKVADIEESLKFYRDILGFRITQRMGNEAVFLSAGGYHHHIALNTWETHSQSEPAKSDNTGLYHFAILLPNRRSLALVLKRLIEAKYPIEGWADHGVSHAIYIKDPEGNGVELYYDLDKSFWPIDLKGNPLMYTKPFDLDKLLSEVS